jgi:tetratricopeptide (TPR) repeat protein
MAMATDDKSPKKSPEQGKSNPEKGKNAKGKNGAGPRKRQPLAPMVQKRLEKAYEHAMKQNEDFNYAAKLLSQCVEGDSGNMKYVQSYMENLRKVFKNNRKGAFLAVLKERGARGALKKAEAQGEWYEVILNGVNILKVNPWDVKTLRSMALASTNLGDRDCQMYYLKAALESNPKDPLTNKLCAKALADRGQYDQAINCWHRVEQANPNDEEAQRNIASLLVQKSAKASGADTEAAKKAKAAKDAKKAAKKGKDAKKAAEEEPSEEDKLREKIAVHPNDLALYYELAQLLLNAEKYDEVEKLYEKAYEISKQDPEVKERWIDVQVQRMRSKVAAARDKRKESPEAEQTFRQLRKELVVKELERCKFLVERYPNNLRFKYDLGVQYQISGQFGEAIKQYQQARNDPRSKGACLLQLGKCFQAIKQHRLAMQHYEMAIEEIPDREADNKKDALYQAAKLAMDELKDNAAAGKHLSTLASLDYTYKDVSDLLAKLHEQPEDDKPEEEKKE